MTEQSAAAGLVADGVIDAELAALLLVLARHDVPLVVAGRDAAHADRVRRALIGDAARGGGVLLAESLDEVVRLAGGRGGGELPDDLRDIGVLVVVGGAASRPRVIAAHYVRPLERDAGGHIQRRGPAVLATYDEPAGEWAHFAWAVTDELAERAAIDRHSFEDETDARRAELTTAADRGRSR